MHAARPTTIEHDWPMEFRDPKPITRRISKARAARRLVENVGELRRRGYRTESLAQYEHRVNHQAWRARKATASLAAVIARLPKDDPRPWTGYMGLPGPRAGRTTEIARENAAESRKVKRSPAPSREGLYPLDWEPTWPPRGTPTTARCECEASHAGRELHRWRTLNDEQACVVYDETLADGTKLSNIPLDPGPPLVDVDFEQTCQAMSAIDHCKASVHFPAAIDQAAHGRTTTTVRGMPGQTIDWLDHGKLREDGTIKARWVGREVGPGPFEAMSNSNWEWSQFVGHRCTQVAVHEGIDTERGYRPHSLWVASEDRLEREYADGPQRLDIHSPPGPDNVLFDDEGRVLLSLTAYEYFRRACEVRKGGTEDKPREVDRVLGYFTGFAAGTYIPQSLWWELFNRHVVKTAMEREKAKIVILMRSLRFDPRDPKVRARIDALDKAGRETAIKKLYGMHRERGIAIPV